MISFNKGVLAVDVPEWLARLIVGRKRFDAVNKNLTERADIHGQARASLRLGRVVTVDMEAERAMHVSRPD